MVLNKKIWIVLISGVLLIAASLGIYFFVPQKYFGNETIDIHLVIYQKNEDECIDITNEIDQDALETVLQTIRCMRYRERFAPYWLGDVQYEIRGTYNRDPFYLVLGNAEINYLYASSDQGGYPICEQERWIRVLDELNPYS